MLWWVGRHLFPALKESLHGSWQHFFGCPIVLDGIFGMECGLNWHHFCFLLMVIVRSPHLSEASHPPTAINWLFGSHQGDTPPKNPNFVEGNFQSPKNMWCSSIFPSLFCTKVEIKIPVNFFSALACAAQVTAFFCHSILIEMIGNVNSSFHS